MIKSSIERLAESIGYDIGQSDDTVQSDLLNGFGNALANSMQPHALQTQLLGSFCPILKLQNKYYGL